MSILILKIQLKGAKILLQKTPYLSLRESVFLPKFIKDIYCKDVCIFCGEKGNTIYVKGYGIYDGGFAYPDYYHKSCMKEICSDPENYGHEIVDKALHLLERKEFWENADKMGRKVNKDNVVLLKAKCKDI